MDMLGKRFRPLANSPRYAPKKWVEDSDGVMVEQERTALDRFESDLAGSSAFFDHTKPVTEADAEANPALRDYIGGRAIFPKATGFDVSTPEGKIRARKQADDWSRRAQEMHDRQEPIRIADKPQDDSTTGKYFSELKRAD